MADKIIPTSINGHDISSTSVYVAKFLRDSTVGSIFESTQATAEVVANFPQFVYGQPQGKVLVLTYELMGANKTYANIKQLKAWHNTRQGEIVLGATNENGDTLQLTVKPIALAAPDGFDGYWQAKFWVSNPVWTSTTQTDDTTNVAADSHAWTETNGGSDSVRPRLTITPKAQKSAGNGPASMRRIVLANRAPAPTVDINGNPWPIEITGGFDAVTKIKAGTMHPQGYDVHVLADGVEQNRYLSNWGAGYATGDNNFFGSNSTITTTTGYKAQRFRLPGCSEYEQNTITEVGFYLYKTGTPTGTLTYKIRNDSGGLPGTVVATSSATANVSTLGTTTTSGTYLSATISAALNARTWYWLELDPSGITFGGGSITMLGKTVNAGSNVIAYEGLYQGTATSTDESAWTTQTNKNYAFRAYPSGNAKIWVPMQLEAGVKRTLSTYILGQLLFREADGNLGLLSKTAWVVDTDCMTTKSKIGTTGYFLSDVGAGLRGTTGVAHERDATCYLVQPYVQLLFNDARSGGQAPLGGNDFQPPDLAPAIDGVNSTNSHLYWKGPWVDPLRPGAWRQSLDDSVALSDSVSSDDLLTTFSFEDAKPSGDYINRNVLEQSFPIPIVSGSNKITLDEASIPGALSVQHLLTNQQGAEETIATHRASDSGTGKTISPTSDAYRYRIRVLNEAIVGCETSDATDSAASGTVARAQVFVLDNDAQISTVALRIKWSPAVQAGATATISIIGLTSGSPDDSITYGSISSVDVHTGFSAGVYGTITAAFTAPVALKAGTYALSILPGGGWTNNIVLSAALSAYARGQGWEHNTTPWTADSTKCYWFRLYGEGTVQNDTVSGTGATCAIDNIDVQLDATYTPYVAMESSDQNIVYLSPTITIAHPTGYGPDNTLGLTAVMKVNGNLDIDFDACTATNDDADLADSNVPFVLTDIDESDPCRMEPGANTVTYAETGQTGSGVDVRWRWSDPWL